MRAGILALVLVACGSDPAIRVETVRRQCLASPPPEPESRGIVGGPEDGCPKKWAACLDVPALASMTTYLAALRRYAERAYRLCGPEIEPAGEKE